MSDGRALAANFQRKALRVLDAPGVLDDYYCNVLSWSSANRVAVGLASSVYLYDVGGEVVGRSHRRQTVTELVDYGSGTNV